jgi:hypothetical protein
MNQFTQLNLGSKPKPEIQAKQLHSKQNRALYGGVIAIAMTSGLLLLAANGCSEEKKAVIQPPSPAPQVVTPAPVAVSTPAPVEKKAQKKKAKKRPSTVTYAEPNYGVSFRYPKSYILKTGDEPHLDLAGLGPVRMNFVQPGGTSVVAIELPRDSYPGADISSAFFSVNVNSNLTPEECSQFASSEPSDLEDGAVPAAKVKVGNMEFDEMEDTLKQADAKYYHVFQQGACYEFGLGMGTAKDGSMDKIPAETYNHVFDKLEKILSTVKIEQGVVPEVAAQTPAQTTDAQTTDANKN